MKTFKQIHTLVILALCSILLAACGSSDTPTPTPIEEKHQLQITFSLPDGCENGTLNNISLTFTEQNTNKTTTLTPTATSSNCVNVELATGLYKMDVTGTLSYTDVDNVQQNVAIAGYDGSIQISAGSGAKSLSCALFLSSNKESRGFVLAEIFCAGTATPQGSYYYADKYFVIYNNTDHVLYADSLVIAESEFLSTMKENYEPNIMNSDMAVAAMYMIPGRGHDVPVQPGGKLLIVDNALNHKGANSNSWDLTTADYEWFDESTNPDYSDVDNPDVPNLEKIYCYTRTMWSPHTQGFRSYALARMQTDKETFLIDNMYGYSYHLVGATGEADMTGNCYRLPNSWIIDAVNMSSHSGWQWNVISAALDRGYTYNSEFNFDDSRLGKSVRRKVERMDGSRAVLQDTNNSTDDFEPRVEADPFHIFGL